MKYTYILMFFGGLGSFFRNHGLKYKNGPVIDYDLVLLSLPMLMSGAVIGVLINRMLPQLAIDLMLIVLLY